MQKDGRLSIGAWWGDSVISCVVTIAIALPLRCSNCNCKLIVNAFMRRLARTRDRGRSPRRRSSFFFPPPPFRNLEIRSATMSTMIDVREQQEHDAPSTSSSSSSSSSSASPLHKASTTQTTSSAEVGIELLLLALAAKGELGADCPHGTQCRRRCYTPKKTQTKTQKKKKGFFFFFFFDSSAVAPLFTDRAGHAILTHKGAKRAFDASGESSASGSHSGSGSKAICKTIRSQPIGRSDRTRGARADEPAVESGTACSWCARTDTPQWRRCRDT
jgi:hypothetical protein